MLTVPILLKVSMNNTEANANYYITLHLEQMQLFDFK
jgi:hypothetical protein